MNNTYTLFVKSKIKIKHTMRKERKVNGRFCKRRNMWQKQNPFDNLQRKRK